MMMMMMIRGAQDSAGYPVNLVDPGPAGSNVSGSGSDQIWPNLTCQDPAMDLDPAG